MYKALIVAGLLLVPCGVACGDQAIDAGHYLDGNKLMHGCDLTEVFCEGYVAGVSDADRSTARALKTCFYLLPPNAVLKQTTLVVRKFMIDHPEQLHQPGPVIVFMALQQAFPCPK